MRFHSLEAVRGVAAWIVLFGHFSLAFLPETLGLGRRTISGGLVGTPIFFLFNGTAAVYLFFVLSGYVLTFRYFEAPNARAMLVGMLKRWPRLAGPVLVVVLVAMALFAFGAYFNLDAASLTGSTWLRKYARTPVGAGFEPSWLDAVLDASVYTFFLGGSRYNTNLWTMRVELFGSYIAWILAIGIVALRRQAVVFVILPLAIVWSSWLSDAYAAFTVGVSLAYIHSLGVLSPLTSRVSAFLVASAVGLLSIYGAHGWLEFLQPYDLPWYLIRPYGYILGAVLLLHVFRFDKRLLRLGSGSVGRWLGRLSFPVYLAHTLVLTTFSSWLYVLLRGWPGPLALCLTFAGTVAVVLAAAIPLALFDEWWTKLTTRVAAAVFERIQARVRNFFQSGPGLPG